MITQNKYILDVCCGARMFWFDREHRSVVYMDNRQIETELCDGRMLTIAPDIVGDFRDIPFPDERFRIVVFDPPHLIRVGDESWLAQKYGKLDADTWRNDLKLGFAECFRVLEDKGLLIFKWNEEQIGVSDILKLSPISPLLGSRRGKTIWLIFIKERA